MVLSLESSCIKTIANSEITNLNDKLNSICYEKIVEYQIDQEFKKWKLSMNSIKIELNIKDIEVSYDMYLDEPTYFIFVKKKVYEGETDDDDEEYIDEEYELYRNEYDSPLYNLYHDIAKKRGLI